MVPQSSRSVAAHTNLPLSPAERARLCRRRFRGPSETLEIRISDENINGLVKRGYLDLNEIDDTRAISRAMSLFLWDALLGFPRKKAAPDCRANAGVHIETIRRDG